VEALLQIHSYLFSHSIKLRGLPLSAITVSLRHLPRCLRSAVTCGKTPSTVTSSEPFKIFAVFCYTIKTNSRTIHSQVLQPASEGKGADINALQPQFCLTRKQWTWPLCS